MKYRNRECQRLYECEVYTGDPDAKRPKVKVESVVAWNAVDANRKLGDRRLAKEPEPICFVWPKDTKDPASPLLRIESTSGPTDEVVTPTVAPPPEALI